MPEYVLKSGIAYRVVTDQLGSVRQVINSATGEVVQRMDYDEYGNVTNSSGQQVVPMGFAGGLYDQQIGLARFGARDYDFRTGRWITKDPLLFASHLTNHYLYASNNPINLIDPKGNFEININQAVAAATIFAAITDMLAILDKAIASGGRDIDPRDWISITLDFYGISAGTYNFAKYSNNSHVQEMESSGIQALAKSIGFNEGFCDLSEAIAAGVLVGSLAHISVINPKFQKLVYTMNLTMAVYAGVKVLWKLDDY